MMGAPAGTDTVLFGKWTGQTYAQIYEEHPEYAMWVCQTEQHSEECSAALRRLATYLRARELAEANGEAMDEESTFVLTR